MPRRRRLGSVCRQAAKAKTSGGGRVKKLLSALGIIAAVLLLLIVAVLFSIGPIAGWFINHKAGDFIEASVSVDGVSANLPAGRVGLRGFQIGQPTGFEGDALARVGSFSLDVGIGSVVGGGPIAIRGVRIEDVELLVVKNAEGAMNVERVAPAGEADGAAERPGRRRPRPPGARKRRAKPVRRGPCGSNNSSWSTHRSHTGITASARNGRSI
jgi:hypothetical protein